MRDPFHRLPVPSKRPAGELERAAEEDAAGAEPLLMWRPIFSTTPERDQRAAIFGRGVSEADRFHAQTTAKGVSICDAGGGRLFREGTRILIVRNVYTARAEIPGTRTRHQLGHQKVSP
jgi:hypothetical protein